MIVVRNDNKVVGGCGLGTAPDLDVGLGVGVGTKKAMEGGCLLGKKKTKTIVLLGGMGPQASARIYNLLIEKSINDFGARDNEDFPEMMIYSIPVPDFVSNTRMQELAQLILVRRVKSLKMIKRGYMALGCNTAHVLADELRGFTKLPFVSMIDQTVNRVLDRGFGKVGLLASSTTIAKQLYHKGLINAGIQILIPTLPEQKILDKIIHKIIAGDVELVREKLTELVAGLENRGAEAVILGCTELPLAKPEILSVPIIDATECLVQALLDKYYRED